MQRKLASAPALLLAALLLALPSTSAAETEDPPFMFSFEVAPTFVPDDAAFDWASMPIDMAVDSSDNVYILYYTLGTVQKYSSDGTLITTWNSSLNHPDSIAIDSSDNIYISEGPAHRVLKLDSDGNILGWLGKCTEGTSCDIENERSMGFSCTDETCTGLGAGNRDGQFREPRGIDIGPTGNIYVADLFNNRIQVFDSDGNFLFKIDRLIFEDDQRLGPVTVTVDSSGNIYVTALDLGHTMMPRIVKYDSEGRFIGWLGKCTEGTSCDIENERSMGFSCTAATCSGSGPGSGDGQLSGLWLGKPLIDASDNLYVPEWDNERVQKFTGNGEPLGWAGKCTEGTSCDIEHQRSMGFSCTEDTCSGGGVGFADGQFLSPQAVAINSVGNIFVLDVRDRLDDRHPFGIEDFANLVHVYGTVGPADLTIRSVGLNGESVKGMWTTIRDMDGALLKSGFTPLTFEGIAGQNYKISVANYDGKIFQQWQDGVSDKSRTLNLMSATTMTAVYDIGDTLRGFTPLAYADTEGQPDLTVNAVAIDDNRTLNMWTIIDPQSSDESGTTYKIYVANYKDRVFDHWEDGSADRVRTLTITEDTTITAYYQADPPPVIVNVWFHQFRHSTNEIGEGGIGIDSSVSCADFTAEGSLFSFGAEKASALEMIGGWELTFDPLDPPQFGRENRGAVSDLVVTGTEFRFEGDWTQIQDSEVYSSCGPGPTTVVIEGPCGNDVVVNFAAANGTKGTFRGSAECGIFPRGG